MRLFPTWVVAHQNLRLMRVESFWCFSSTRLLFVRPRAVGCYASSSGSLQEERPSPKKQCAGSWHHATRRTVTLPVISQLMPKEEVDEIGKRIP